MGDGIRPLDSDGPGDSAGHALQRPRRPLPETRESVLRPVPWVEIDPLGSDTRFRVITEQPHAEAVERRAIALLKLTERGVTVAVGEPRNEGRFGNRGASLIIALGTDHRNLARAVGSRTSISVS